MLFDSWLEYLKFTRDLGSGTRTLSRPPRRKSAARRRLQLEPLEDRFLLSSFTVTNTADSGTGSFRAAIGQVNADTQAGTDTINFAIGSGAQTIRPLSVLPTITHSVVIDGTSQPGFAGSPLVNLSGVAVSGNGLTITASNSTIKDLDIRQFNGNGVEIDSEPVTRLATQSRFSVRARVDFGRQRPNSSTITIGGTLHRGLNSPTR